MSTPPMFVVYVCTYMHIRQQSTPYTVVLVVRLAHLSLVAGGDLHPSC